MDITFKLAQDNDLASILEIYNQVIPARNITAELEPVTISQRQEWFNFHLNNPLHPLWCLFDQHNKIVGWVGFRPYLTRAAFHHTAEVSFYLCRSVHKQGVGQQVLEHALSEFKKSSLTTLVALAFKDNIPCVKLLEKNDFKCWAVLPNIADMGDHFESLVIYGYQKESLK